MEVYKTVNENKHTQPRMFKHETNQSQMFTTNTDMTPITQLSQTAQCLISHTHMSPPTLSAKPFLTPAMLLS